MSVQRAAIRPTLAKGEYSATSCSALEEVDRLVNHVTRISDPVNLGRHRKARTFQEPSTGTRTGLAEDRVYRTPPTC